MDVIILSFITSAALSSLTGDDPTVPKLRVLEPSVTRAWPSVPSLVGSVKPENVNAPVISTASAMVILVESEESSVVPFTLKALIRTSPVPLGWIDRSALDPFDVIELVVISPIVAEPVIVGALIVGDVKTLLVSVCDPVNVATVESIANVTVLPDPDVSIPVPPVKVIVSLSRSIDSAPPESAWKSKSSAVICVSTYALIDCCVARAVALLVAKLSSSNTVVTLAPEVPSCSPDELNVPIVDPSTVTVIVPEPESATVTFELFCTIDVVEMFPISVSTYALIDCCVANFVALFDDMLSSSFIPVTVAPSPAMFSDVAATNAPVTSSASATVILVESELSSVVPLTLNALNSTSPVPLG